MGDGKIMSNEESILFFEKYKEDLKKVNRFFVDSIYEEYFDRIIRDHTIIVNEDEIFYRARINKFGDNHAYTKAEINMPPLSVIQNVGRVNPKGIAYFYLANNVETAISEVRPEISSRVTVGKFRLKNKKRVLEFDSSASISGNICEKLNSSDISDFMGYLLLGFNRPVFGDNKDLEYLPYQYFAEYCKRRGLDGMKYISSMNGGPSKNYCYSMFNNNDFCWITSDLYHIKNVIYDFCKVPEELQ